MKEQVERPSWMSSTEESEILERVEEQLCDAFRSQFQSDAPRQTTLSPFFSWDFIRSLNNKWILSTSALVATAAFFFVLRTTPIHQMEPLHIRGIVATSKAKASKRRDVSILHVRAKEEESGRINEAKRWDMFVAPSATLALVRRGHDIRTVKLQHGLVKVHVTPKAVKRFSVQSGDFQVLVRGTIFSVEREDNWLRVEVQRGKVVLRDARNHRDVMIHKGSGVRVDLFKHTMTPYKIKSILSLEQTPDFSLFHHISKKTLPFVFSYALDLASSRRIPLAKRRKELERFERKLFRVDQKRAFLLRMRLSHLYRGVEAQMQLYSAYRECLESKQVRSFCVRFAQAYKKRFPRGMFRSSIEKMMDKKK